jgi:hypothetical protein
VVATGGYLVKVVATKSHVATLQGALARQQRISEQRAKQIDRLTQRLENRPLGTGGETVASAGGTSTLTPTDTTSTPTTTDLSPDTDSTTPTTVQVQPLEPIDVSSTTPTTTPTDTTGGQTEPASQYKSRQLGRLRASYEAAALKAEGDYTKKLEGLQTSYSAALLELRTRLREQGNLDGVLALRTEIAKVNSDGLPKAANHNSKTIRGMQASVIKTAVAYESEKRRRLAFYLRQYLGHLDALEKKHTQDGELEKAIEVRTEKKRISG